MREALAEALSDFPGAIALVSHDRHLIGLVSDTYWRGSGGGVQPFDGDRDDYAAWLRSRPQDGKPAAPSKPAAAAPPPPATPKPARGRANPQRLARAEARVAELEAGIAGIDASLADPAFHDGPDAASRATDASRRRAALVEQLAEAEAVLLELYAAS
ncbi:MAG: ABC transporter ATP-binding protein, partial [Gammaproteobacteria bacterium]|nr:ABC transporter ATP-binding protein [Gammaproteobacteria bacterium]